MGGICGTQGAGKWYVILAGDVGGENVGEPVSDFSYFFI